jgi:hypothetical protein
MNSVWVLFHPKPVSTLPVGAKPKWANCEERKIHQVEKKPKKNPNQSLVLRANKNCQSFTSSMQIMVGCRDDVKTLLMHGMNG